MQHSSRGQGSPSGVGADALEASGRDVRGPESELKTVGVVGLGYVGLPLAVAFASEGCEVIAVDVDSNKIAAIAACESYIEDVSSDELRAISERLHASTRYARLA